MNPILSTREKEDNLDVIEINPIEKVVAKTSGDAISAIGEGVLVDSRSKVIRKKKDPLTILPANMTYGQWEQMSVDQKTAYVSKYIEYTGDVEGDISNETIEAAIHNFVMGLIWKLPTAKQRKAIRESGTMTDGRNIADAVSDMPGLLEAIETMPANDAIIADVCAGQGYVLHELAQMYDQKETLHAYNVDIEEPIHESQYATFIKADVNNGLPENFPKDCDVIFSNRGLQYIKNLSYAIHSIYDHLKIGGHAVLHLGWHFSFKPALLTQLKQILESQGHMYFDVPTNLNSDPENPIMAGGIYIHLKKSEQPLELPAIQSELPGGTISIKGKKVPRSQKYYVRSRPEDIYEKWVDM